MQQPNLSIPAAPSATAGRASRRWLRFGPTDRFTLNIWLALRIVLGAWAAYVSALRPLTPSERTIPLWPPRGSLGAWLERALLAPWNRWDTEYYLNIVQRGYRADDGTAQFHPLLPWLATPIAWLTGQPLFALLLVSSVASIGLLIAFNRLALLDLKPTDARTSTLLLLCAPPAFILFAPYTESLWLLWAVLCLLYARRGQWWRAGLAGALATLTRQQGVFLMVPLAWELWEAQQRDWRRTLRSWRNWLALGLIPAGLLTWLIYRAVALNDLRANLADPQALIFSLLISPSASKVVPVQAFLPPWQALGLALAKLWREPELSLIVDLTFGGAFVLLVLAAWRNLRASYRLYVLTILVVSFGYYTGPFYPYMGLPRHLLLAFPVFIGLAPRLRRPLLRQTLFTLSLLGMFLLLWLYVLHGWTP